MPRKARKDLKSKVNHIVIQGLNKEYIFQTEKNIKKYLEILDKKRIASVKMISYCIMNNHAHLLLFSYNIQDISKYMQKVNTAYSNYYNKIQNRVGYVFKDRFYSQSIDSQRQLYSCINYIHNNPVKAGICKYNYEYKYSSIHNFKENKALLDSITKLCSLEDTDVEFNKFIDVKELEIEQYIKSIENKYRFKIEEIKHNRGIMKEFIMDARDKTDVTLVELSKILGISKTTVSRYIEK